jgi:glutamine synthetase
LVERVGGPVSSSEERTARSFVERHGLWNDEQFEAAAKADKCIEENGLEVVRLSFPDQHGILRGKTVMANEAPAAMRNGCSITTTLLAKDTAHKTVFPVFTPGGGFGMAEMEGAGDFLMIADPTTFRVLPWAARTGWVLCDIYFSNGKPVPFSTRHLYRRALQRLAEAGFDYVAGLEVEFHVFKLDNPRLTPADATWPGEAPQVSLLAQGYQYLTETRFDQIEPMLETLRRDVVALDLPLRSIEVELGPSQCEFTFQPQVGLSPADTMMLFRSAVKQICRLGLSCDVHDPPEGRKRDVERLAPASIAARPALQRQRFHVERERCAVPTRAKLFSRSACPCARFNRLHHPDDQRLQALPQLFAGAGPRDLGA